MRLPGAALTYGNWNFGDSAILKTLAAVRE